MSLKEKPASWQGVRQAEPVCEVQSATHPPAAELLKGTRRECCRRWELPPGNIVQKVQSSYVAQHKMDLVFAP